MKGMTTERRLETIRGVQLSFRPPLCRAWAFRFQDFGSAAPCLRAARYVKLKVELLGNLNWRRSLERLKYVEGQSFHRLCSGDV